MIIRVFRAEIRKGRVSDFKKMVKEQSIPWLEKSDGMLGYFPGAPLGENDQEFLMVSLWRDLDSLKAFAGSDWNHPVVTEEEAPLVATMIADHYLGFGKDDRLKFAGYPENN
jgi:quinol monooxygenase YgiN